jgi:hypothetical protein
MQIGQVLKSVFFGMPVMLTGGKPGIRAGHERMAWFNPNLAAPDLINVSSPAFEDGGLIPARYSAGEEAVSPPLRWRSQPAETKSVVVIVEDPDAPTPNPFVHWLIYNILSVTSLPEDLGPEQYPVMVEGAMQGKNSNLHVGWAGMAPPKGDTPHHYYFQVFAIDVTMSSLAPGIGRSALLDAMAGHVIGRGRMVGTFERPR